MSTQILVKKLHKEMRGLKDDVKEMKQFLFAPLKDAEGIYHESFVHKMLDRSRMAGPMYRFANKESFLKHVRSKI